METREARRWPFEDPTAMMTDDQARANAHDLELLFTRVPAGPMRESLWREVKERNLKEFYLAYGRRLELVFAGGDATRKNQVLRSIERVEEEHLRPFWPLFEHLPAEQRRTGIPGTLHRISRTIHAVSGEPIGVTARVGRTMQGHVAPMLCDGRPLDGVARLAELAARGLLLIGPPNVGKTTVLRELARLLSSDSSTVVVVVDKTLEICGTDKVPQERAIGDARVLTVPGRGSQAPVMIEAIENQSPDMVIVDELSSREECQAARTIMGRGASVVASVHGDSLAQILRDPERNIVFGSVASITLSAKEAEARPDKLRQVQRRLATPVFGAAVELRGFNEWILHEDVEKSVDALLDRSLCKATYLTRVDESGTLDRDGTMVEAAPLIGLYQSRDGFAYIRTCKGDRYATFLGVSGEGPDFSAKSYQGHHIWASISSATPNIWEPIHRAQRKIESDC